MDQHDISGGNVYADDLTWREQEVLRLLGDRLSNREIAGRLHLAESTVKDYVGKILSKLYVKNRREAVERAKELGLLDIDLADAAKPQVKLPAERTPFVGREHVLSEITALLMITPLLTLTGPGGIGKTRLAVKAAQETAANFRDGVFFVPLAPINAANHLVQTIAEALRFPLASHEEPLHQLLRYLRRRQLLLVMDNFEHLLDGVGVVSEILEQASQVKILATSREKLNMVGETTLKVGGMDLPEDAARQDSKDFDAVALFAQSANKVRPGFTPSQDELAQIVDICHLVQGIPLGIELAAAWLHILNVEEIAGELEQGFDILATQVRDTPERHRSMRAVFEHSWALLQPGEQKIFMTLSIFRGGFTRHAAKRVSGASLLQLASLVNKSFLSHDPLSGRLEVHELLRQYAQEQLEKTPADYRSAQEAHAAYYAAFMQQGFELLKGKQQMEALGEIEADMENVRTAWRFYLDHRDAAQMRKFVYCLFLICWIRSWNLVATQMFAEAGRVLKGEQDSGSKALYALAVVFQAYFMPWLGMADQGYGMARDSVQILSRYNDPQALVFAYLSMAVNAYFLTRYDEEIKAVQNMIEVVYRTNNKWLISFVLYGDSLAHIVLEEYEEAQRIAKEGLQLSEEIGDVIGSASPLITLGHAAFVQGNYEAARGYYLRCLKISQETGFFYGLQTSSKYLGKVSIEMGRLDDARDYIIQSLRIAKETGFVRDLVNLLYENARLEAACGNLKKAAELLDLVIRHPASGESRMMEGRIRDSARELLAEFEGELTQQNYQEALQRGRELDLDEVVDGLVGGV